MSSSLRPHHFSRVTTLLYEKTGIFIEDEKTHLIESRILRRMSELQFRSMVRYLDFLDSDQSELSHFIDIMTTNLTSFYREPAHFERLSAHVESLARQGQRTFTAWCAACSTGEEAYTMAMTMREALDPFGADFRILATDLSTRVIEQARRGRYVVTRCQGLPVPWAAKYLLETPGDPSMREILPTLRSHIVFDQVNLSVAPYPMKGPFDAIFCRNVLIYFDVVGRQRVAYEIERLLSPRGLLFLGHSESFFDVNTRLKQLAPAVYRCAPSRAPGRL